MVYLILKSSLEKLERVMKRFRNSIFEKILLATLTISDICVTNFRSKTDYEYAKYLRTITENMDREMAAEVAIQARFH